MTAITGDLTAALARVEVYAGSRALEVTCDCGTELTGFGNGFSDASIFSNDLLTLIERALAHRHVCPKAAE